MHDGNQMRVVPPPAQKCFHSRSLVDLDHTCGSIFKAINCSVPFVQQAFVYNSCTVGFLEVCFQLFIHFEDIQFVEI